MKYAPILIILILISTSCTAQTGQATPAPSGTAAIIENFEQCAAAGFAITKSMPPQCHAPDGRVFVKKIEGLPVVPTKDEGEICKNQCGDGTCQEIVCMALGCPCPETADNCPEDCG